MKIFNTIIDTKTFFQRGIKRINDDFGVYLITGYQGSGKTFLSVYLLDKLPKDKIVYTNIKSLKMTERKIEYFDTIDGIVDNIEESRIFIIDEISKKYTKDCKQDKFFYSWLQQSRKRKRIVFLITQEYLQVPQWLRGVCRFVYTTSKVPVLPLFVTRKGYAFLDNETLEWRVQPTLTYIYKRTKKIANCYDTMEPVTTL